MKKEISNFLNLSERNYYIWKKDKHPKLISLLHEVFKTENELNSYIDFDFLPNDIGPQSVILDRKKYKKLILEILNLSERNYYIWKNDDTKSKAITIVERVIFDEFEAQFFIETGKINCNNDFNKHQNILDFFVNPSNLHYSLVHEEFKIDNMINNKLNHNNIPFENEDMAKEEYVMMMNRYCILQSLKDVAEIRKLGEIKNNDVRLLLAKQIFKKFGQDDRLMDLLTVRELNQFHCNILENNFKLSVEEIQILLDLISNNELYVLLNHIIRIEDKNTQIKYFDAYLFFIAAILNYDPICFYAQYRKIIYSTLKKYNLNQKENRVAFFINVHKQLFDLEI